jgi:hypothetical protein
MSAVLRQPPGGTRQYQHHDHALTGPHQAGSPHTDLRAPVAYRPSKASVLMAISAASALSYESKA